MQIESLVDLPQNEGALAQLERPNIIPQHRQRLFLTPSEPDEDPVSMASPAPAFKSSALSDFGFPQDEEHGGSVPSSPSLDPMESDIATSVQRSAQSRRRLHRALCGPYDHSFIFELRPMDGREKVSLLFRFRVHPYEPMPTGVLRAMAMHRGASTQVQKVNSKGPP